MTQPEQVKTTARESVLYQAGFEAGKAQGELSAAASAGAAGAQLSAAATCFRNLADNLRSLEVMVREGKTPKPRQLAQQLLAFSVYAEEARRSMVEHQQSHEKAAQVAKAAGDQARVNFNQQVARAQMLAPKPRLLDRLFLAFIGDRRP